MASIDIKVNADVSDAVRGLEKVESTVEDVSKANKGFGLSLADVKAGLDMAGEAIEYIQAAIAATVGPTLELATQQRDLARAAGQSAEDAGALIQVADDLGVSYSSLIGATKKLNAEGFSLNITTLKQLSAEYAKLPDPVSKAQFAAEKFGRAAGPEMQKLLEQGADAIQEMTDSARESALVLSGESVAAAREYEIAQDGLNDSIEEAKVLIGVELIPVLTGLTDALTSALVPAVRVASDTFGAAVTTVDQYYKIVQMGGEALANLTGVITDAEYQTRLYTIANDGVSAAEEAAAAAARSHAAETERLTALAATYAGETNNVTTPAVYGLMTATDLLNVGMQKYSASLLFAKASEGLTAEAAIALGVELGVVDGKAIQAVAAVDALKQKYDENRDGAIDATEAAAGYSAAVLAVNEAINAMPASKDVAINVVTNYSSTGTPSSYYGSPAVIPGGAPGGNVGFSNGADFVVPPGYPNDSFPMRVESGERVIVIPRDKMQNSTTNNYTLQMQNFGSAPSIPDIFSQQAQANAGAW